MDVQVDIVFIKSHATRVESLPATTNLKVVARTPGPNPPRTRIQHLWQNPRVPGKFGES